MQSRSVAATEGIVILIRTHLLPVLVLVIAAAVARPQGYAPKQAEKHMTTAKGLEVSLFASEPEVRQPIFVKCDDRGRLWTIQYLQYPNPAGLNRVKVDRWSRTVYDRVPEPPPRGPRGADKITILEDTDGDGRADRIKDFADGLNLVTGVEFGYDGVFVLNVPYLLFCPDKNRDDVPDADPEVLLTGFGMEDAQSLSNHLTWGPDGWLYGVNGSTTTCRIRGIEFQQGLWRYHPITREFELFCEGGSNCYGVTFDANGECFYSTNGGPFVHAVQGGYYYKSFGKHGPLHNLFAYHYFPELERDQAPGGPPTGGTVYLADAFPAECNGAFIAGNFLGHTVSWWKVAPNGSTVTAKYGGVVWDSHDTWSGPTDVCLAPDGSLYVSDFYDQRTAHPDPDANWDRSNGRIYKIGAQPAKKAQPVDVTKLSTDEIVDLLEHKNQWFSDRARLELARRREPHANERLRQMALQTDNNQRALQGIWALNAVGALNDEILQSLLDHPYPYARFWAVRLIGDKKSAAPDVFDSLVELAMREDSAVVRSQLAATAKRLPATQAIPVVEALLRHSPNDTDPRVPWLIWWAIESKATSDAEYLVSRFATDEMWSNPAARENCLRLIRRFAAAGTSECYDACFAMLASAPPDQALAVRQSLRQGLSERAVDFPEIGQGTLFEAQAAGDTESPATAVRNYGPVSGRLRKHIEEVWRQQSADDLNLELALRSGIQDATESLSTTAFDSAIEPERRIKLLQLFREYKPSNAAPQLAALVLGNEPDAVRLAALDVLAGYEDSGMTQQLLAAYPTLSISLQSRIRDMLVARPASTLALLQSVEAGAITSTDVAVDQLRRAALHGHEEIDALVRKHWGNIGPGTAEEKLATMRRYNNDLRAGTGDASRGKELFAKHCGNCHQLHSVGNKVGPDLTTANRLDLAALLANIVDPSAVIRREYLSYVVSTTSGRVISGLMADQNAATVTILDANNDRIRIPRNEIDSFEESNVSLMPERILDELTPQQLRDLFTYIQGVPAG